MPASEFDAIKPSLEASFAYSEGLFTSYRNTTAKAAFPFGHGLSYTSFRFGTPELVTGRGCIAEVCARLRVRNNGKHHGAEVVQAYLEFPSAENTPSRLLRGFQKTRILAPGESDSVSFNFTARDLSIYRVGFGWAVQHSVRAHFGSSSLDIRQVLQLRGTAA